MRLEIQSEADPFDFYAKDAGLGRESLYKALTPGAKPRYDTMLKLLHALGVKLSATPVHQ
ncbi:helix-turn-helix domain-containing transcriptional regulator [Thiobacillus sp.]